MKQKIRVIVVDDHEIVRMGIVSLLENQPDIEVIGEANNGSKAILLANTLKPDVVVMDLMMPKTDGAAATSQIVSENPDVGVLILTTFEIPRNIYRAIAAGARGAIFKSAPKSRLLAAIRAVASGQIHIADDVRQLLNENDEVQELTPRQLEILTLVSKGLTNAEIAKVFGVSSESVKTHIAHILVRTNAATRSEAVTVAIRNQLLKL